MIIALWAFPPDLFRRTRVDIVRRQLSILRRMPLCSQGRFQCGETVRFDDFVVRTYCATRASISIRNNCVPLVIGTSRAFPPSFDSRTCAHIERRETLVLCRMPLRSQARVCICQALAWLRFARFSHWFGCAVEQVFLRLEASIPRV